MLFFFSDGGNDSDSDNSNDKVGEVRFVPEDKSACKMSVMFYLN